MGLVNSSRFTLEEAASGALRMYFDSLEHELNGLAIEALTDVCPKVARESVRKLRAVPYGTKYPKGWAVKVERGRVKVGATVYGKHGTYQLAHLLEYGHATRNGDGRKYADTPAYPHIAEIAEWAENETLDRVMEYLDRHTGM